MEHPPFEDVFPIENGDVPLLCLFTGGYSLGFFGQCSEKKGNGHPTFDKDSLQVDIIGM